MNTKEPEWSVRVAVGTQAWHEYVPIRTRGPTTAERLQIYRSFNFGSIATVVSVLGVSESILNSAANRPRCCVQAELMTCVNSAAGLDCTRGSSATMPRCKIVRMEVATLPQFVCRGCSSNVICPASRRLSSPVRAVYKARDPCSHQNRVSNVLGWATACGVRPLQSRGQHDRLPLHTHMWCCCHRHGVGIS